MYLVKFKIVYNTYSNNFRLLKNHSIINSENPIKFSVNLMIIECLKTKNTKTQHWLIVVRNGILIAEPLSHRLIKFILQFYNHLGDLRTNSEHCHGVHFEIQDKSHDLAYQRHNFQFRIEQTTLLDVQYNKRVGIVLSLSG